MFPIKTSPSTQRHSTFAADRQQLDASPATTLLSIAGMILTQVLLNHFLAYPERGSSRANAAFVMVEEPGTLFLLPASCKRNVLNKTATSTRHLYTSTSLRLRHGQSGRDSEDCGIEKFGCFGKLIEIFRQFHNEMTTLRTTIHLRPSSLPTRGVKQGWVLAPALKSPTRRF